MSGGLRLLFLSFLVGVAATAILADDATSTSSPAKVPLAPQKPVVDEVQGHKITDPYRWIENAASPETQQGVNEESAYTRSVLDPLSGRDQLHKRLTDLMSIGTISAPQIGGKYYFYTKREGSQNQPVLFVREGVDARNAEDFFLIRDGQRLNDGNAIDDDETVRPGCSASPARARTAPTCRPGCPAGSRGPRPGRRTAPGWPRRSGSASRPGWAGHRRSPRSARPGPGRARARSCRPG